MRLLLCLLFWSLVDSQTVPYVSFRGETLPNNSYVDLSLVGDAGDGGDSVQCHTDLITCCSMNEHTEGQAHRGNWYFPDGSRVPFSSDDTADIYMQRGAQRVELRRRGDTLSPSGIYRCGIETNTVHDDKDPSVQEIASVGLYGTGGKTLSLSIRIHNHNGPFC